MFGVIVKATYKSIVNGKEVSTTERGHSKIQNWSSYKKAFKNAVYNGAFFHINNGGKYDGWTYEIKEEETVYVTYNKNGNKRETKKKNKIKDKKMFNKEIIQERQIKITERKQMKKEEKQKQVLQKQNKEVEHKQLEKLSKQELIDLIELQQNK